MQLRFKNQRQPARAASVFWQEKTNASCMQAPPNRSADRFLFDGHGPRAARWALGSVAKLPDVDLELIDGAAERVTMHPQLAGGAALVALIFLQNGQDESLLEFAHTLRIENVALVHLQDECFQLIFHGRSLSSFDVSSF